MIKCIDYIYIWDVYACMQCTVYAYVNILLPGGFTYRRYRKPSRAETPTKRNRVEIMLFSSPIVIIYNT